MLFVWIVFDDEYEIEWIQWNRKLKPNQRQWNENESESHCGVFVCMGAWFECSIRCFERELQFHREMRRHKTILIALNACHSESTNDSYSEEEKIGIFWKIFTVFVAIDRIHLKNSKIKFKNGKQKFTKFTNSSDFFFLSISNQHSTHNLLKYDFLASILFSIFFSSPVISSLLFFLYSQWISF